MLSLQKFGFLSLTFIFFGTQAFAQTPTEKPQIAKNTEEKTSNSSSSETTETSVSTNNFQYNRIGVQNDRTMPISLNEAIRKSLENNNDIEISRTDVRIQETNLRSLIGIYDPVITVSPNFSRNNTTGSTATKDFRVNSDFSGQIQRGGGSYSVFFNNNRTENNFAQSQLSAGNASSSGSALYSSSLGVNYTQPLFRNLRIDNNRRQIKIQRKRLQQSDADFRRQTINTISQVQRAYWDLVFALRDQQNKVDNLNLAKENLRQVEAKIAAGTLAPLARAEVNTEVANRETEVLNAAQQVSISENTLKQLILRDPNSDEWNVAYVPTDKPVYSDEPVNLDLAMKDAMENRLELRRLKLAREINQIDINYFRNQTKPQIDLNTSFSLGGLSNGGANNAFTTNLLTSSQDLFLLNAINTTRISQNFPVFQNPTINVPASPSFLFGGFNRSFANLFRTDAPNFSVGVTFSFPLRNTRAKADLAGAQIQQEQISAQTRQQENTVFTEVRNAVQALETSRLRVLSARKARQNAEIQLEGERKLFDAGRSNTFILFQRENSLANARNAEIRAETDYNKAISDLQRVTSTTFQMNNIQIDSPVEIEDK